MKYTILHEGHSPYVTVNDFESLRTEIIDLLISEDILSFDTLQFLLTSTLIIILQGETTYIVKEVK